MTQTERLNTLSEKSLAMLFRIESLSEATRNMLDNFRAQRTFHRDNLEPVKKEIRAVYRRFDKKVTIRF